MTTVRKTSITVASLIIFAVSITLIMHWIATLSGLFFYKLNWLLNSQQQIGRFYSITIKISFWLLLIASGIDAVFREKIGVHILESFARPIVFFLLDLVWVFASVYTHVNIIWFWLFNYVCLFICLRGSFKQLSGIEGAGPTRVRDFLKNHPSVSGSTVSIIDQSVLRTSKIILLAARFAVLITTAVLFIQYKQIFGL